MSMLNVAIGQNVAFACQEAGNGKNVVATGLAANARKKTNDHMKGKMIATEFLTR